MFPLSDRARREVCTAAFVLLAVLPTIAVGAWCAWRHSDGPVRLAAERLQSALGLSVSLQGLAHPRPGVAVYRGLEVIDPETGRTLFRCPSVEVTGTSAGRLVMTAEKLELEGRGLEQVRRIVEDAMEARLGPRDPHWVFSADEVRVVSSGITQSLVGVQASMDTPPGGVQAELAFRLPSLNMPEPARVRIGRNRQTSPPAIGFELSTGGAALPCGLLGLGLAEFQRAGAKSRFSGYLWANQGQGGWQGEMVGQWTNLDLGELLGDWCVHKLNGPAQVYLQFARFRDGRVEEAGGTLSAGPGIVSRSLIQAAVDRLSLARGADPNTPGELVPYEQLAAAFLLNSKGLQLQGRCAGIGPGSVLIDRYCRLLGDPAVQPQPVASLLQLLVSPGEQQVPASRQSERLLRLLPLPEIQVPPVTARHP